MNQKDKNTGEEKEVYACDSHGNPILDPDGSKIPLQPGDTPIIIRGGSLQIFSIDADLDDADHAGQHGRHFIHRDGDKRITSIDIRVAGQPPMPPIVITNRNCTITFHYEE
jgi:hypothetical protein